MLANDRNNLLDDDELTVHWHEVYFGFGEKQENENTEKKKIELNWIYYLNFIYLFILIHLIVFVFEK